MTGNKIIHVHLHDGTDYYFGSLIAIYDVLTPEQIGISYNYLVNFNKILPDKPFINDRCIIKMGELHRKKTNRGNPNLK